jgi:hypothetical protein
VNYNPLLTSLIEIFEGYSRFDLNGRTLFFRHFSLKDQNAISLSFNKFKNLAESRGIENKDQIFQRLKEDQTWSDDDEIKILELQSYLDSLRKTKSKLLLPSQKEEHQKLIDEEDNKLNLILLRKNELVGMSSDGYAGKMSNEEFLRILLFKDESLKNPAFSEEEFGELTSSELSEISKKYFELSEKLNDENIQKIVLEDFFNMYISFCENSFNFFGKYVYQMTSYQMKLLLYGRIFHNIFQYNEDIPEHIRKDPKAIFEFVESKKTRDKYQNEAKDSDGSMVFGATSKDIETIDPGAKRISLSEEIAKNGGTLNMEQMMQLMGN